MAKASSATLIDRVSIILEDTGNTHFSDATISSQLQYSLRDEISDVVPFNTKHWLTAAQKSKYISIENWDGIIRDVKFAVYPLLLKDDDDSDVDNLIDDGDLDFNRRRVEMYGNQVRLILDYAPCAEETAELSGTSTFTAASEAVTGSGTSYTTQLRPGYAIKKSNGNVWYRVASVTSDTALVLAQLVETADDGADTAGGTHYWRSDCVLFTEDNHYLEATATDLTGAVDNASDVSSGVWSAHFDNLGASSVYPKGMQFTIAGVDGLYTLTQDTTCSSSEGDFYFEPALKGIAKDNAVVTFYGSSLSPQLENILCEITAAKVVKNWLSTARTGIASAVTAIAAANTQIGLATARIAQAVTDIASGRTLLGDIATQSETALDLVAAEVAQAIADLDSGRSLVNTITVGGGDQTYANYAAAGINNAIGYLRNAQGYLSKASLNPQYGQDAARELQVASTYLSQSNAYMNDATMNLNLTRAFSAQQKWADDKYAMAMASLRRLRSPELIHTYTKC